MSEVPRMTAALTEAKKQRSQSELEVQRLKDNEGVATGMLLFIADISVLCK